MKLQKILMVLVLIGLLILVGCKEKEVEETKLNITSYNNYSFIKLSDKWLFDYKYNDQVYSKMMYYNPNQLENVMFVNVNKTAFLENKVYYVSIDKDSQTQSVVAGSEIATFLGLSGPFEKTVKSSLTYESPDIPKIDCGNVTTNVSVLLFTTGNKTSIENVNGCYIFTAPKDNQSDFIKLANRFVYSILDVME